MRRCLSRAPPALPPIPYRGRRRQPGAGEVDIPLREPFQDFLECDTPLETSQRRTKAVVGADAECQVLARFPVNVENVAVGGELAMVTVGRSDEHHHDTARRHCLVIVFDVAGDIPGHMRGRGLVAQ